MSYERKNIIFYGKNLKLTKNNTIDNFFCNKIFAYNHCLFFGENIPHLLKMFF